MAYSYSVDVRNAAIRLSLAMNGKRSTYTKDDIVNAYNVLVSEGLVDPMSRGTKASYLESARNAVETICAITEEEKTREAIIYRQQRLTSELVRLRNEALKDIENDVTGLLKSIHQFGWLDKTFVSAGMVYAIDVILPRDFDPDTTSVSFDELMDLRNKLQSAALWEGAHQRHNSSSACANFYDECKRLALFKVLERFDRCGISEQFRLGQ